MTLKELKFKVFTAALERHKGNVEKAAWDLKVSSRTVYSFKAKQKKQYEYNKENISTSKIRSNKLP